MTLDEIAAVSMTAHVGQTRKFKGEPYFEHPRRVAELVQTVDQKAVALLHDVLEDTHVNYHDLLNFGVHPKIVASVMVLTRKEGENYDNYLRRIIDSNDRDALAVKIADLTDNLSDLPAKDFREAKYKNALQLLTGVQKDAA